MVTAECQQFRCKLTGRGKNLPCLHVEVAQRIQTNDGGRRYGTGGRRSACPVSSSLVLRPFTLYHFNMNTLQLVQLSILLSCYERPLDDTEEHIGGGGMPLLSEGGINSLLGKEDTEEGRGYVIEKNHYSRLNHLEWWVAF